MGMEILGRTVNVVPLASGVGLRCDQGSGWTFIVYAAATYTLTTAPSFAGTYVTPGNIITRVYTNTSTTGTAAWVKTTQAAANTVILAGATTAAFYVDNNSLPDTYKYMKLTASAGTSVIAIQGDLLIQRNPANLPILSA
jgi:hypothetical protein